MKKIYIGLCVFVLIGCSTIKTRTSQSTGCPESQLELLESSRTPVVSIYRWRCEGKNREYQCSESSLHFSCVLDRESKKE